ncbi:tRNA (adenine(22)-N(1))-methyltransferase [Vibrio sp. RC27]
MTQNVKLGTRLTQLASMTDGQYDHIWDCCCDHGYLGAHLLTKSSTSTVHFVDIVPELMAQLEDKLNRHLPDCSQRWQVHCADVAKLPLESFSGRHLVIIAGIGGDLMVTMLEALLKNTQYDNIELLLCPVNNAFHVRKTLRHHHLSLIDETVLEENGRYYEVIKIKKQIDTAGSDVALVGSRMWQVNRPEQYAIVQQYLDKILLHYHRSAKSDPIMASKIIAAYQKVNIESTCRSN